ncbi:hypothetical protein KI387_026488, partial [Taxus chinensis]
RVWAQEEGGDKESGEGNEERVDPDATIAPDVSTVTTEKVIVEAERDDSHR